MNRKLLHHTIELQKDKLEYVHTMLNDLAKVALIADEMVTTLKLEVTKNKVKVDTLTTERLKEWDGIVREVKTRFYPDLDKKVQEAKTKSEKVTTNPEAPKKSDVKESLTTEDKALQSVGNTDKLKTEKTA